MQQKKKDELTFTLFLIQLFDLPAPRLKPDVSAFYLCNS